MSPIRQSSPDPAYLDAFLQGARFALFALQARLDETGRPRSEELEEALDEFHDLYKSTRSHIDDHEHTFVHHHLGKN